MSKLILSASLLLICKILSAQLPNDRNKNIIASYFVRIKGLNGKDSLTVNEILTAGGVECSNKYFKIDKFWVTVGDGNCIGGQGMVRSIICKSDNFNPDAIATIRKLQPGYYFWIENVTGKNKSGQVFSLKDKFFTIIGNTH
jgi:hypothetical protein